MSENVREMREPDHNRLLGTIQLEEPDAVPLVELGTDGSVKEAFSGRPIRTLGEEAAFWHDAGCDHMYQRPNCEYAGLPASVSAGTRMQCEAQNREERL